LRNSGIKELKRLTHAKTLPGLESAEDKKERKGKLWSKAKEKRQTRIARIDPTEIKYLFHPEGIDFVFHWAGGAGTKVKNE